MANRKKICSTGKTYIWSDGELTVPLGDRVAHLEQRVAALAVLRGEAPAEGEA